MEANVQVAVVEPFALDVAARASLLNFERELLALPQITFRVNHYFAEGLYVREIFIPAGCALTGVVHTQDCISTISQGVLAITGGDGVRILRAPMTMPVPAGSKKAGYAIEDTVFLDCYANPDNERDLDKLEARLSAGSHETFLLLTAQKSGVSP